MSFSETAHEASNTQTVSAQEQLEGLKFATTQERANLNSDVINQFPDVPQIAVEYLAVNCPRPEHLPLALQKVQQLLKSDPTALDDPDLAEFELDECLAQAEIAAIDAATETEKSNNEEKHARVDVLSIVRDVSKEAAQKGGGVDAIIKTTRAALEAHEGLKTPEAKEIAFAKINQVEAMLAEMRGVFSDPEGQAAFEQILAKSSIDLTADSLGQSFAPVLAQVEASNAISQTDKTRLRMIVTGSEVQDVLSEKSEDGEYVHNEQNKRQIRSGVEGYTEPSGRQIIEAKAGDHIVTKDVSGWSGEDVGLLVELMHYWNVTESNGTTGFVENIYQVDFSVLDSGGAFDPLTVKKFQQIISHMTGGFAGYDGDMENFEEKQQLIQNQSRLLSDTQTAFGWENNQEGTSKVLKRLGVWNEDGHPNMDVIKSFGDYTQRYYAAGTPNQADLVDYLYQQNPERVRPLTDRERETMSVNFEAPKSSAA
jgi:hypothetical protein